MKTVCLTAPAAWALSGVSTHLRHLQRSELAARYRLVHFQVGREGRVENGLQRLGRLALGPAAFSRFLRRERIDLVHFNSSMDGKAFFRDMSLALAARTVGARIVFQIHGGELAERFLRRQKLAQPIIDRLCRLPDAWVFLYEAERRSLRAVFPVARAEVIPNGVEAAAYDISRTERSAQAVVFGYLGRLVEAKGIGDAIEALALLKREGRLPPLEFRIAGDGPDRDRLRALAAEHGLDEVVSFPGTLYDAAKIDFLKNIDVLLFPSHGEGLPYTLLEAMAAGAAVVTTPLGGIPDVLVEEENALFVPPKDPPAIAAAVVRLARSAPLRRAMGEANAARIRVSYTTEAVARRIGELYAKVLCES